MTLKAAMLRFLEERAPNTYYTYTVETPLPSEILASQIRRQETASELLGYLRDNIRQLLTEIPIEALTELITEYTSSDQLSRNGFIVNPSTPYRYDSRINEPIVLISAPSSGSLPSNSNF